MSILFVYSCVQSIQSNRSFQTDGKGGVSGSSVFISKKKEAKECALSVSSSPYLTSPTASCPDANSYVCNLSNLLRVVYCIYRIILSVPVHFPNCIYYIAICARQYCWDVLCLHGQEVDSCVPYRLYWAKPISELNGGLGTLAGFTDPNISNGLSIVPSLKSSSNSVPTKVFLLSPPLASV